MSELCYATTSRKRPTGLDILGGRLRDMFQTRFFWKSRPIFVLICKQSCQKPKKVLTMLKVVEIVKSCWATEAHP